LVAAAAVDSVVVVWPTQISQMLTNVDIDQCLEISEDIVTPVVGNGQADRSRSLHFDVWPNPVIGQTQISFNLPQSERYELTITDLDGSQIGILKSAQGTKGENSVTWNRGAQTSNLPAGVYLLRLTTKMEIATRQVVLMD
jgi:hypothetical protein